MSETVSTEPTVNDDPHGSGGEPVADEEPISYEALSEQFEALKKDSRKWEARAKENKSAADELAELKRESMSADQKAQADLTEALERATKAEEALKRLQIAAEFGLSAEDAEALASVKDEDALRTLAERLADRSTGPKPNPAQGKRPGNVGATTNAERFAEVLDNLF